MGYFPCNFRGKGEGELCSNIFEEKKKVWKERVWERENTTDTTRIYNIERGDKLRKYFVCVLDKVVQIVVNTTDVTIFYNIERENKRKYF